MDRRLCIVTSMLTVILSTFPVAMSAATFCMRDRSSIHCQIIRETPTTFEIKRDDVEYNIAHRLDVIKKAEVYTVLNDTGMVIFPDDLTLRIPEGVESSITEAQFQRRLLDMQIEADERVADRLGSIRMVLWLQFAVALTAGTVIALGN